MTGNTSHKVEIIIKYARQSVIMLFDAFARMPWSSDTPATFSAVFVAGLLQKAFPCSKSALSRPRFPAPAGRIFCPAAALGGFFAPAGGLFSPAAALGGGFAPAGKVFSPAASLGGFSAPAGRFFLPAASLGGGRPFPAAAKAPVPVALGAFFS